MTTSRPSRTVDSIDGRSLVETAVVTIGTTGLFLVSAITALVATAAVGDEPLVTVVVALAVGIGTIGAGLGGARLFGRWLGRRLDRRAAVPVHAR
ncbi:hypothetical protein [Halosolutus halophilus]|uniref:hypothetical protein n=1 Tax=Halosolutus halophilus TaxID=1552990 RepID=UPI0022351177|nr:hypothetical protein [Halosolutus halophilus]